MRTNAWITLENSIAVQWWNYYQWLLEDEASRGPEPPIDDFGKAAMRQMTDLNFAFQCFKKATISGKQWRALSVWDVTENHLQKGYDAYGDAESGGDYAVMGLWRWQPGDTTCALDDSYNWRPNQVLKYMPDECSDPPDCNSMVPATYIRDVQLLAGQPPRYFPAETRVLN